jgi:drug/metabolite transporter (DMT)-like permease
MIRKDTAIGIGWMIAGELLYVVCWSAIKVLGSRLPLFEIVFFRSFLSLFLLIPMMHVRHGSFRVKFPAMLLLRSCVGYLSMFLSFYAMIHISIGNATTLYNTMPIFVAVLSPLLSREPFARGQFLFVLAAFAGIGMILKPDTRMWNDAAFYALLSGIFAAIAMILIRKLSSRGESTLGITLFFTSFAAIASAPLCFLSYVPPTPHEWIGILFLGGAVTFAQLFMTRAYKFGHASTIAPFAYSGVIGAYVAGVVIFHEVPDVWSAIGALVIIASGAGVMLAAPRAVRDKEAAVAEV